MKIFQKDQNGNRPVYGKNEKLQKIRTSTNTSFFMNIFMVIPVRAWGHHIKQAGPD